AGHGGDQQDPRVLDATLQGQVAREVHQPTKRTLPDDVLGHGNRLSVDGRGADPEIGFVIAARRALEHLAGRGSVAAPAGVCQWVEWIVEEQPARIRCNPSWPHSDVRQLVPMVKHAPAPPIYLSLVIFGPARFYRRAQAESRTVPPHS